MERIKERVLKREREGERKGGQIDGLAERKIKGVEIEGKTVGKVAREGGKRKK